MLNIITCETLLVLETDENDGVTWQFAPAPLHVMFI